MAKRRLCDIGPHSGELFTQRRTAWGAGGGGRTLSPSLAWFFAKLVVCYDTAVPPSTPTCTTPPTALASRVMVCNDRLALAWNSRVM